MAKNKANILEKLDVLEGLGIRSYKPQYQQYIDRFEAAEALPDGISVWGAMVYFVTGREPNFNVSDDVKKLGEHVFNTRLKPLIEAIEAAKAESVIQDETPPGTYLTSEEIEQLRARLTPAIQPQIEIDDISDLEPLPDEIMLEPEQYKETHSRFQDKATRNNPTLLYHDDNPADKWLKWRLGLDKP